MVKYVAAWPIALGAILLSAVLAGCLPDKDLNLGSLGLGQQAAPGTPLKTAVDFPVAAPSGGTIPTAELDPDVAATLLSLKALLDGHSRDSLMTDLAVVGPVDFPNAMGPLEDFQVVQVRLATSPVNSKTPSKKITSGVMRLGDPVGRQLDIAFAAQSDRRGAVLALERLEAMTIAPAHPLSEAFILPEADLPAHLSAAALDYVRFHEEVSANALTAAGLDQLQPGWQKHWFVVFLKEPLLDGALLQFDLASGRAGAGTSLFAQSKAKASYKVFDGGWTVAVVQAEMDLTQQQEQWLKVTYQATPEAEGEPQVVGLFPLSQGARGSQQIGNADSSTTSAN
ncbi:MAG: hypothetical protein AAF530_15375 [Pseudomonadota bacterium]